ncbi:alpha/beta hydrolase fold domain-containing protein [Parafrankia sp. EUN1f]|uniref:alpha/beta hydrolase fold domain-containing protein n=1 Tax=Parafrankia sp. EUN1f TaxID=102897 RepID=UPI0001C473EB|nr:alpha/beta hydrolase fold domain-containing protein [Parafrankia sp. EUN1f]EFC86770.1 Alpha/beta hydrolase fold-3 domain protein [Parafrankia sp. EUN1f]
MTDAETAGIGRDEDRLARLERRIGELEDEREIRYVLSRYGYMSDFGSVDDFVDLFTPDGALDISMGSSYGEYASSERWEGSARLRDFVADPEGRWDKSWYGNVMHVQGNNVEVTVTGNTAIASGYALSIISRDGGLHVIGASSNRWELAKVGGRWLIRERKLRALGHREYAAMVLGPGAFAASDRGRGRLVSTSAESDRADRVFSPESGSDASVHPELRGPLAAYHAAVGDVGIAGIVDVHERRAAFHAHARRVAAARTMPATVTVQDQVVPGVPGSPAVRTRLYFPAGYADAALPAWLYLHGGGLSVGDLDSSDLAAANLAADSGCVILSVDYRLAPEVPFPGAVDDCAAALTWLSAQATRLHLRSDRIGVHGVSAGGLLAASLALRSLDGDVPPLAKQVLIYPMLDERTSVEPTTADAAQGTWSHSANASAWADYLGPALDRSTPPRHAVPARAESLRGLPPTYLEVGALDILVTESVDYARRLIASGVTTEFHVYPGAYHAFDVMAPASSVARDARARRLRAMIDI